MTCRIITSEDIMTVTKDLCGWCSFGNEQLVWSMSLWLQFRL